MIAEGIWNVNRRSKLAVVLTEVNDQLVALSNNITFQVVKIMSLLNVIKKNEIDVASLSNSYCPWKTLTHGKITTLQEFYMLFYDDLRNLHCEIDVMAANTLQKFSSIASLSNNLTLYIPQSDKLDLVNPAGVAPLQSDVNLFGFDLNISIQDPPRVSPEDAMNLPPTLLTATLE